MSNQFSAGISRRSILAAAATGALGLSACVKRDSEQLNIPNPAPVPLDKLKGSSIIVGDQDGIVEALMKTSGAIARAPYEVHYSSFTTGPAEIEAENAQQIDYAEIGTTPGIFGAAAHARFRVVSAWDVDGEGEQIVVPQGSSITKVEDLRGKTVAVARGTSSHGHLLLELQKHNIKPTEITFMYLAPADANTAFTEGNVPAWATWDPYTANVERKKFRKLISAKDSDIYAGNYSIASIEALSNPDKNTILRDFSARVSRGWQWAQAHVDEWSKQYSDLTGVDYTVSHTMWSRGIRKYIPVDQKIIDTLQQLADACFTAGQIPSSPHMANYCDSRYNLKPEH